MPPSPQRAAFSLFGVQIRIDASWVIMAVLIAWSLASGSLPMLYRGLPAGAYWTMAAFIVVGLAVSIILHELSHTLVGRAFGVPVGRITLFLFGGVAEIREEPKRPGAELAMAVAGPGFSVVFSLVLAALALARAPQQVTISLDYLAKLNMMLAVFNMVPAFPLDGGRVLRALIWMATGDLPKATRTAARVGEDIALALVALGLGAAFTLNITGGLWWILIGLFVFGAARAARREADTRRMLLGHPVAELMSRDIQAAPANLSLARFVNERLLAARHEFYPVVGDSGWQGAVEPSAILRIPREAWTTTTLGEVCTPASVMPSVRPGDDASEAMRRMGDAGLQHIPVVEDGDVVGVVALRDILARFDLWRRFGPASRPGPWGA